MIENVYLSLLVSVDTTGGKYIYLIIVIATAADDEQKQQWWYKVSKRTHFDQLFTGVGWAFLFHWDYRFVHHKQINWCKLHDYVYLIPQFVAFTYWSAVLINLPFTCLIIQLAGIIARWKYWKRHHLILLTSLTITKPSTTTTMDDLKTILAAGAGIISQNPFAPNPLAGTLFYVSH